MKTLHGNALAVALAIVLGGCSLAPTYVRPAAPVPDTWVDAGLQAEGVAMWTADLPWQDFVQAPELKALVTKALAENRDLRQALLRVEAVRAQYRIQRADRLPGLEATGSGSNQRQPGSMTESGQSELTRGVQAGIGLTAFEIDLFGRLRSLSEAAMQEYLSAGQATRAAQISLVAEVSRAYVMRESAVRRHAISTDVLQARQEEAGLMKAQFEAGTTSALDYQQTLGLVEEARVEQEQALRQSLQADNLLALLVAGDASRAVAAAEGEMPMLFANVRPEVSSEMLQARPDVRASEHQLIARHADIGAARAAFFPRISLTGFLGSASPELSGLFESGSRAWSFSPVVSLPIFSGGRNRANLDLARVRKDSAIANYEHTIQAAFREVSDALVASNTLQREKAARANLRDSTREAERLSRMRYDAGVDSSFRKLDAQRAALNAQLGLLQAEADEQIAQIDLFKALGGGAAYVRERGS